MPEFEILNKLTDVFHQDLVSALKKRNKQDWLTHPVSSSELTDEITDGIKEDFITPINLRFKTDNANKLDLWTIIKPCDNGSYEFSQSRERLQVWLIDNFLNHTPTANVFSITDKKNTLASLRVFLTKDKAPLFYIGSKDNLYFWAFESEIHLKQGGSCNLDWDNHQTLTLGHLKTVDFYSFPKEIRDNLLHHALNNPNKPGDFFEFFFNKTAAKNWDKMVQSDPQIKAVMLEKLGQTMNDGEVFVRELIDHLNSLSTKSHKDKEFASLSFNNLLCQVFKLKQINVITCLFKYGLCKDLSEASKLEYQAMLFSMLQSESGATHFKTLCRHLLIDLNSKNDKGETLLIAAAKQGRTECLKELLAQEDIKLNAQNNVGCTALSLAACYGQTECLKMLLKKEGINANLPDFNDWTPLIVAASWGHEDCVQALLKHGVLINAKTGRWGDTALSMAALNGEFGSVKLLLSCPGIDISGAARWIRDGKNQECIQLLDGLLR